MRTLRIELGSRSYPIRIGAGLIASPAAFAGVTGRELRVVTDRHVARHYLEPLLRTLGLNRRSALALPPGERAKTLATAARVTDWLLETRTPRDAVLVALGGGVVGDLAGFAAAIYQRGIDFVQVATTLLAQVDSSVGGKTGVNHRRGKNLIGAFHQPRLVVSDLDALRTLPEPELRAGLAEVVKYGLLGDAEFFAWLEKKVPALTALDAPALAEAVERCCAMKARIVAEDEREELRDGAGARVLLNLGHTFGHAIEAHTRYRAWLHGEAVAVGLCMAADLSARLGWLKPDEARRCRALVSAAGLPVSPPAGLTPARFRALMAHDKKVRDGRLRLVLLRGIGQAVVTSDFEGAALDATLKHFCSAAGPAPRRKSARPRP